MPCLSTEQFSKTTPVLRVAEVRSLIVSADKINEPILLIHGERDTYIDASQAGKLAALARGDTEVWVVPGARHNECRTIQPQRYEQMLTRFFTRHLAGVSQPIPASRLRG